MYEQNIFENKQKSEQEKYMEEMDTLIEELERKAKEKFKDESLFWIHERRIIFFKEIRKNVPNYGRYLAWHKLMKSSLKENDKLEDFKTEFPHPYELKNFISELINELEEENKNYIE
jgi:hypothetical protein